MYSEKHSRDVANVGLLQQVCNNVVRQRAHDLGRVGAWLVLVDTLPLGDPGAAWVGHGNEALENGRRARLDRFLVASEVQVVFAVGTAFALESLPESATVSTSEK